MPDRLTLSRRKGWRLPEGAVSVARPTTCGNPWRPGNPGTFWLPEWLVRHDPVRLPVDQRTAVHLYRQLLTEGPNVTRLYLPATLNELGVARARQMLDAHRSRILSRLPELRGRDLACWCKPGCPCHADVLLELANA